MSMLRSVLAGLVLMISGQTASAAERIITIGDSITSGLKLNASGTFWFCPADGVVTSSFYVCNGDGRKNVGGYQPDLRGELDALGFDVDLYNWGFAGKESWELVDDLNIAMAARSSEYVLIMAGVNDLNDGVSVNTTVFNVQAMANNVIADGRIPILGSVTPHFGSSSYNPKIELINDAIEEFADENGIAFADHYGSLIGNFAAYTSGDFLHLDDDGDAVLANLWAAAFVESQPQPASPVVAPAIYLLLE